jgi:long-chain acyl-CoA synthetase
MECDPLFAQAFVLGENRPFVTAVAVLHGEEWKDLAAECGVDPADPASLTDKKVRMQVLKRVKRACAGLPQYGVPRAVHLTLDAWTIENGMLTPTLKLKRRILNKQYEAEIESLYQNFGQ